MPQSAIAPAAAPPARRAEKPGVPGRGAGQGPAPAEPLRRAAAHLAGHRPGRRRRPADAHGLPGGHDAHRRGLPRPPAQRRLPARRADAHPRHAPRCAASTWSRWPRRGCSGWPRQTGETVNLAVLTGDRVLYLVRLRNSDLVTANIQVGSTLPAVHTSIGKLLLAHLDDADLRERITEASFPAQHGPNAKVSLDELRARAGPDPRAGLGDAGRGARVRAALGGRADHRRRAVAWWPGSTSRSRPGTGRPSGSCASSSRSCWPPATRSRSSSPGRKAAFTIRE